MTATSAPKTDPRPGQGPRIRMCRGCCCGTRRKHPDVDHDGIAGILAHESGSDAELVSTDCLWQCGLSNVVVVNPSAAARRAGARPVWIQKVNTLERARAIAEWVRQGGPGTAEPPDDLRDATPRSAVHRSPLAGW